MRGSILAQILRRIARAVENIDEFDLEMFDIEIRPKQAKELKRATAQRQIRLIDKPIRRDKGEASRGRADGAFQGKEMLERLQKAATREDAAAILDELKLTRTELVRLAQLQDVHVTKDDNVSKIKEKLVQVAVGSRLSSLAIRGKQT